jgi:PAS domain S-box-containing protein
VFEAVPLAVLLLDRAGRVTGSSEGARRLTGYEAHAVAGEHWSRLLVDAQREAASDWLSRAAADGELQAQASLWRHDEVCVEAVVSVVPLGGVEDGFVVVFEAATAPDRMHSRLSQAAHDLHSPLGIVSGRIELLLHRWDRLDDGERQEYLRAAAREADRASALVSELLER